MRLNRAEFSALADTYVTPAKFVAIALLCMPFVGLGWHPVEMTASQTWAAIAPEFRLPRGVASAGYLAVCCIGLYGLLVVPFLRSTGLRIALVAVLATALTAELILLELNGTLINPNMLITLWQERASASNAFDTYQREIAINVAVVALLVTVLSAAPRPRVSLPNWCAALPLVGGLGVVAATIGMPAGPQLYPPPFGLLANSVTVFAIIDTKTGRADPLTQHVAVNPDAGIPGPVKPRFKKIVVIMDESVRGDHLSINAPGLKTTPHLVRESRLINFGVAMAGANCSSNARMMFRFGMRQSDLPDKWSEAVKRPTVWQFARKAGFKTVYIDAFAGPLGFHSGFSPVEKRLIDRTIKVIDSRAYLRDHQIVERLLDVLREPGPAFIYVDKYGVHSPYHNKVPPDFPIETAPIIGERERLLQQYHAALRWSVDGFFQKLLPRLDLDETLLIYTSDHGQSLLDGGYRLTHCSGGASVHAGEAYVPLFAMTGDAHFGRSLAVAAARTRNRFSHFEIFPTLLLAMGYEAETVAHHYGPSLLDVPSPVRRFLVGFPYLQPRMVSEAERAWARLKVSTDIEAIERFKERYRGTAYEDVARARLDTLRAAPGDGQLAGSVDAPLSAKTARRPEPGRDFSDCNGCPTMIEVATGEFLMGSPDGEAGSNPNEGPQRLVRISNPIAVGKFEVTFDEWDACVRGGGCKDNIRPDDQGWGRGRRPVINVSWIDASAYVAWLRTRTGKPYRLLSEAEWEYAARAGTTTPYSTGHSITKGQANIGNAGGTVDVSLFQPNAFGLHDMHGNVWEWVSDCYHGSYGDAPTDGLAVDAPACRLRVMRGGSWYSPHEGVRSAYRDADAPESKSETVGFRVALDL